MSGLFKLFQAEADNATSMTVMVLAVIGALAVIAFHFSIVGVFAWALFMAMSPSGVLNWVLYVIAVLTVMRVNWNTHNHR